MDLCNALTHRCRRTCPSGSHTSRSGTVERRNPKRRTCELPHHAQGSVRSPSSPTARGHCLRWDAKRPRPQGAVAPLSERTYLVQAGRSTGQSLHARQTVCEPPLQGANVARDLRPTARSTNPGEHLMGVRRSSSPLGRLDIRVRWVGIGYP